MDNFENFSASDKAEAAELQRMIAIEQQKAEFQAQVCMLTMLTLLQFICDLEATCSRATLC